jgi:hypothetical protein
MTPEATIACARRAHAAMAAMLAVATAAVEELDRLGDTTFRQGFLAYTRALRPAVAEAELAIRQGEQLLAQLKKERLT